MNRGSTALAAIMVGNEVVNLLQDGRGKEAAALLGASGVAFYTLRAFPLIGQALGATMFISSTIDEGGLYPDQNLASLIGKGFYNSMGLDSLIDYRNKHQSQYESNMKNAQQTMGNFGASYGLLDRDWETKF